MQNIQFGCKFVNKFQSIFQRWQHEELYRQNVDSINIQHLHSAYFSFFVLKTF